MLGGQRRNAATLQRFLQLAEVTERAADHQLRLALIAGAVAHLLEPVVDEIQFELVVILDVRRIEAKHAHFFE